MADTRKYLQAQKFTLSSGITTTETSLTLTSFNFPSGEAIASGDLGSINYGTLEPGTEREEQISFTGLTTNGDGTVTLTGLTRGLGFGAVDTYSEQSNLKIQHGAGSVFILSNTSAFYDQFVNKGNDETMVGYLSVPTPTSGAHAVTKDYADSLTTATSLSYDKVVIAATAGESLAEGDLVYFDDTDNEWKRCKADTSTTVDGVLLGVAQGAGTNGAAIAGGVLIFGLDPKNTSFTPGVKLYAGDTLGTIVETPGTITRAIGWSDTTGTLVFDPDVDVRLTQEERDLVSFLNVGGLIFGGDGSDGVLNITSGTTTIDLSSKSIWQYSSITIASGATLTFDGGSSGDKVPVLKCQGNFLNEGTITTVGKGVAGGSGGAACSGVNCTATSGTDGTITVFPFVDATIPSKGLLGTGGTGQTASPDGGAGGVGGALASKNSAYFAVYALNGSGGGGGGGGADSNVGTPGAGSAGGAGSLGLVLEVIGSFTNSGTITLNGVAGTAGVNGTGNNVQSWGSGGGGGGGGGGAGSLVCRYKGTYSNTGTITATGGTGGAGGSVTNLGSSGGSPRYGAGGGGGSGGASAFNNGIAGSNGSAPTSSPSGGAGGAGGSGVYYLEKIN